MFLEIPGEKLISVDRLDSAPSLDKLVEIADIAAVNRQRSFYGWAILKAEKAINDGREVLASPQKNNPYHADIILPDEATEKLEIQQSHAQQLADSATWMGRQDILN